MMTGVRRDGDPTLVGDNRVILGCREKPRRDGASRPYPKPTQVVGQSMPRRTSESWLRNSAKCPRNFGRRGARTLKPLLRARGVGRRGQGEATVY